MMRGAGVFMSQGADSIVEMILVSITLPSMM